MDKQLFSKIPFLVPEMLQSISPRVKTVEDLYRFCSAKNPNEKFPVKEKEQKRMAERISKDFMKTHQFSVLADISTKERNKRMMNGLPLKRRIDATIEYLPELEERFAEKFSHIPYRTEFLNFSLSLPFSSPNQCDAFFSVDYAIAIWILDAISHTNNETMAKFDSLVRGAYFDLMDDGDELAESIDFFCDSLHDPYLIRDLVCILNKRNDYTKDSGETDMFFYNLCMAKRTEPFHYEAPEDIDPSQSARIRYEKIMELIPGHLIQEAISSFEEKLWLSVEHYFEDYEKRYWSPLKEMADYGIRISNEVESIERALETQEKNVGNVLLYRPNNQKDGSGLNDFNPFDDGPSIAVNRSLDIAQAYHNMFENTADMERMLVSLQSFRFVAAAPHYNSLTRISFDGKRVLSADTRVMDLPMKNPYEICFALLYLLENGSDLPWLYTFSFIVLDNAVARLPWARSVGRVKNVLVNGYDPRRTDVGEIYEDKHSSTIFFKDLDNGSVYDLRFPNGINENDERFFGIYSDQIDEYNKLREKIIEVDGYPLSLNLNLAQIIFNNADNFILPREMNKSLMLDEETLKSILKQANINKSDANFMRRLLQLATFASWKQTWTLSGYGEALLNDADEDYLEDDDLLDYIETLDQNTFEESEPDIDKSNHDLYAELTESNNALSAAKEEIKQLKAELWQARRDLTDREDSWKEERKEADQNRQELIDLREIVFNRENEISEEDDEENTSDVSFPYTVSDKKLVSFGGHDTWFRAIKGMFNNVVFIDRDRIPDENLIKNADCVWIQWNNLKHKHYYKIINCARANRIPVRYFKYASPQKCALQLVEYDREN